MRVVLASGSPRRRELLKQIYDEYEVITSAVDERSIEDEIEKELAGESKIKVAEYMVKALSKAKAEAVFESLGRPEDTMVIGADTTVAVHDELMGKPIDRDDAVRMLRKLSLEKQYVLTGVCILIGEECHSFVESSAVIFNPLDDTQEERIQRYCDTDEPYDKAGAYGIQALGDELVSGYEGEFNNIIGLPVERLKKELSALGLI